MMMFFAVLYGDYGTIKRPADRIEIKENMLYVWEGNQLVAVADLSIVLFAHIYPQGL